MTNAGIAYVKALLQTEEGSLPHVIAERVWALSMSNRDDVLEYLTSVMTTNPGDSRAFEVAYDLVLLMGLRGVAA